MQATRKAPPSTGYYRRATALLALDEGQSVGVVTEFFGVSRQRVYNGSRAFAQSPRPETLADDFGGGHPTLWTEEARTLLSECFRHRPEELGYTGINWTVALLRTCLLDRMGLWLSDDTIRRHCNGWATCGSGSAMFCLPTLSGRKEAPSADVCGLCRRAVLS